ncbi:MAG: ABC transporter permease [Bacteroidota bacterium]
MISQRIPQVLALLLLMFVLVGYVLYPLGMTIAESLLVEGETSISHYSSLVDPANKAHWEAVRNSVSVSLLSVLFSGIVGVFLAFVFTQFEFPFKTVLSRIAVLPIALPPLVGVIAFLFVFGESGIIPRGLQHLLSLEAVPFSLEGISAIVAIHAYSFHVYFYLFVSTGLRNMDPSVLEAASSLGSSQWRTFLRVVVPELRPALLGASILTFMASMASFSAPFLFGGDSRFMTTQIFSTKLNGEMNLAAAQAIALTLVSIAFFILLRLSTGKETSRRGKGAVGFRPMHLSPTVRLLLLVPALMLLAVELLPVLTIFLISFAQEGSWTWQILPTEYTIENYSRLFADTQILDPIVNSITMSIITVAGAVVVGVGAAYLVTKGVLRRWRLLMDIVVTLPFAIPGTVVALSLILAFDSPGFFSGYSVLVGTFWILPLAYFVRTFPLVVRSTSAALEQLDDSLNEAAQSFGAGPIRRFFRVLLPIILPGVVSGSILTLIAALGEFVSSVLLYTYSSRPISIEILSQLRMYNFGSAAAYCVFLLLLISLLTFFSERMFRSRSGSADRLPGI